MSGKVAAAVAAAEQPTTVRMWNGRVKLPSTGREVMIAVPVDLNPVEMVDLVGFLATQLPRQLAEANRPASRLTLARAMPPSRPSPTKPGP